MSIFDYPRVNFKGKLRLNPGTANNEDYAQPGGTQALLPATFGPYAGAPLGLLRSRSVQAQTYGMGDDEFVEWIQRPQPFDVPPQNGELQPVEQVMPAEWNYYGDMSSTTVGVEVVGVQTGPGKVFTAPSFGVKLSDVIGAAVTFDGSITDINPEGSPPATQFFVGGLTVASSNRTWVGSSAATVVNKGVGLWINFYRNVSLTADDGSGSYVHHVVRGAGVDLPGFTGDGLVLRYYLSLPLLDHPETEDPETLARWYRDRRINPKTLDIAGTIAPWHEGDPIAGPVGRLLISRSQDVPTGGRQNNGMGMGVALAPAVAHPSSGKLVVDFIGTFPDDYDAGTGANPKFGFGPVRLRAGGQDLGEVDYMAAGNDAAGWLLEFDLPADADGALALHSDQLDTSVLSEVDYPVFTDQLAVYGEQGGSDTSFVNQGAAEPIRVSVYHRGEKLDASEAPEVTMWRYSTVPIQDPGRAVKVTDSLPLDEPIQVPTGSAGAYLLTFLADGETNPPAKDFPPADYGKFAYPPATFVVTWAPQISVRILPNDDYSAYYADPTAKEPVGNELLTFAFLYDEVLRTYALLYPAMDEIVPLADPGAVARSAKSILAVIDPDPENWLSPSYMPRTRDLSQSRRTLLAAWCRRQVQAAPAGATPPPSASIRAAPSRRAR